MTKASGVLAMITGMAAGALLAVAPASADPPPHPKVDQKQTQFIDFLTQKGVPFPSAPKAVALAKSTCSTLSSSSPTRVQDAANAIQTSFNMRPEQVQLFAGAAANIYCPDVKI